MYTVHNNRLFHILYSTDSSQPERLVFESPSYKYGKLGPKGRLFSEIHIAIKKQNLLRQNDIFANILKVWSFIIIIGLQRY